MLVSIPKHPRLLIKDSWKHWQRMAAVLIGILILTGFLFVTLWQNKSTRYRTAYGETRSITLPDGSVVTLNANSSLTVSNDWENSRQVWLEGEAFFAVKKKKLPDSKKGVEFSKFTVYANTLQVEVLGTEFNVSGRRRNTTVVLNSGKIKLSLPLEKRNILMKPGDLVEVSGKEQTLTKKVVNPQIYNAWIHKEWILDNLSIQEIALKIEETYGVKVIITHKDTSAALVTGAVPTENLDILLQALSTTLNIKITRNQEQIMIE
jgi:ferric-dicitrate binding protein FerR (iron transport regulator)